MSGKPSYDNAFVEQLLAKLDQEYRLRRSAESRLAEMSDVAALREGYERKLADKDKAIADKDKDIADKDKAIADKDKTIADKDKTIADKEDEIIRLNQRLQYLLRKVWGRMSEKSKLSKDPRQLEIDFGKRKVLPSRTRRRLSRKCARCMSRSMTSWFPCGKAFPRSFHAKRDMCIRRAISGMKTSGCSSRTQRSRKFLRSQRRSCMCCVL